MKYRVGIIGAGYVVGRSYLPNLTDRCDCELGAICSAGGASAQALADEHGIPRVCRDHRELLADDNIDVVCVCAPPHLHRSLAEEAMAAGKHVLVEKPVAANLADSLGLLEQGVAYANTFAVTFNQTEREENAWLVQQVLSGALGELLLFDLQWLRPRHANDARGWKQQADKAGGGVFMDLAPHLLHLVLSACPQRRSCRVLCRLHRPDAPNAVDDSAFCMIDLDDGIAVQIRLGWDMPEALGTRVCFEAIGTGGAARSSDYDGPRSSGWENFFDNFFAHVKAGTKPDLTLAADIMQIIDAAYRSNGGSVECLLSNAGDA